MNDGGPAFPNVRQIDENDGRTVVCPSRGLSMRDYFAGQALAGYLASYAGCVQNPDAKHVSDTAYEIADAMLKAREERKSWQPTLNSGLIQTR